MNNQPPPFDSIRVIPDSPSRITRKPHRSHSILPFLVIAGLIVAAVATVVILAANPMTAVGRVAKSPNERAVLKWLEENEGDPDSVEIISIEGPRIAFGDEWMRAKYRATGPFGGPVVSTQILKMADGGAEPPLTDHIYLAWNDLRMPGESEADHKQRVANPLGDWIKEKAGK